jgi:hypothetical protein
MGEFLMNDWWDEDDFADDKARCPNCDELLPKDHMDTDSGDCIACEDRREEERSENEWDG